MGALDTLYAMDRAQAIATLRGNYTLFCEALDEIAANHPVAPLVPRDDTPREAALTQVIELLRRDGMVVLKGLFNDPEALEQLRAKAQQIKTSGEKLDPSVSTYDETVGGQIWSRPLFTHYRAGMNPDYLPPALNAFLAGGLFGDILTRTFGITQEVKPTLVVIDNMQPTTEYEMQWWHQDFVRDQIKAMILIDPVTSENGPMQIVPGTHRFEGQRRMIDFSMYSEEGFGDIPYHYYNKAKPNTIALTGEPGDVILFNTRTFHAVGRPRSYQRQTLTAYFADLDTPLNKFLRDFNPGHQV
jgi:hypothetical protein